MAPDDPTVSFIMKTQIKIFEDARHDLQLTIAKIADRAKLPTTTVNKWAQGVNTLSLWGVKKLLRVKELAPLLSRLFEPEEYALVGVMAGVDYDEIAEWAETYTAKKLAAHRADSECQEQIGPNESAELDAVVVAFPGKVAA